MQPIIRILSDETINQIAAGEVIESPASVVKELIENSLDAGAKKITVEIVGGGLKLIRITDDGSGMHPEDAHLCVKRHATSKILKAQDLFHIVTKGFRGEALAAIASISKMTLATALDKVKGIKLEVEKGEVVGCESCARTRGTTIDVRSLFYNVPPRKKFQKTAAAISAEIFRIVTIMALSHPEVQFELISNGRKSIQTIPNETLEARAKLFLGEEFFSGSFPLDFEEGTLKFFGLVGAPTQSRVNKTGQYLFINRRAVSCESISEAVREGYGTRMDVKRHPIFLLHLNVPSDLVDVNVHPQKLQVRLRFEELFREKVSQSVEMALAKKISAAREVRGDFKPAPSLTVDETEIQFRFQEASEAGELLLPLEHEEIELMGQTGCYLFIKDFHFDGVILVDAKAASFRIAFEELLSKWEHHRIEKQGLLVPFSIDLTAIEAAMVLTHQDAIESLGFSLRPIGKDIFMIEAIPPFVDEGDVKAVLSEMARGLQEFIGKKDYNKERQKKLALIAARFVKKNKTQYSREEAQRLFKRLKECKSPLHCPKGSLTMVHLSHETIEDLFRSHRQTPTDIER